MQGLARGFTVIANLGAANRWQKEKNLYAFMATYQYATDKNCWKWSDTSDPAVRQGIHVYPFSAAS